jgi:hypothetical protein
MNSYYGENQPMRLIIFKSEANSQLRAFAGDPGGQRLPSQFAPWHAIGVVAADKDPPYKLSRQLIERAIAEEGYQLFRYKPKS